MMEPVYREYHDVKYVPRIGSGVFTRRTRRVALTGFRVVMRDA